MEFLQSRHFIIFSYIISFLSGMVTITLSYFLYLKNKSKLFRKFKDFFLIFLLTAIFNFLFFYNEFYILNDKLEIIFDILLGISLIFFSYFWIILLNEIIGIRFRSALNLTFLGVCIFLSIYLILLSIFINEDEAFDIPFMVFIFCFLIYYLFYFIYNIIILFGKVKNITNIRIKIYILSLIILMLIYIISNFLDMYDSSFSPIILIYFLYNIITCFFFYKHYLENYEPVVKKVIPSSIDDIAIEYSLTDREKEILIYIYKGYSNREIAELLKISPNTVKKHNYRIYKKTGVTNRVELSYIIKSE